MQDKLIDQAISAALKQDWQKAVDLNQEILRKYPNDIPTLNRLATAFKALGMKDEALNTYRQVITIDKYNSIAQKNIEKLRSNNICAQLHCQKVLSSFIDEPGKTATMSLSKLANPQTLNQLQAGQILKLVPQNHWISVTTLENTRVGVLADETSFHLKRFIKGGNKYEVAIRSLSNNKITIFIKETYKDRQFYNTPSFIH